MGRKKRSIRRRQGGETIKEQTIIMALRGLGPSEIKKEFEKKGIETSVQNIEKECSIARKEGYPIPLFNKRSVKARDAGRRAAATSSLSEARLTARRAFARRFVIDGWTEAEIIASDECRDIDVEEMVDLARALEPLRQDFDLLRVMKGKGTIPEGTNTYRGATEYLLSVKESLEEQLATSQQEGYVLQGSLDAVREERDKFRRAYATSDSKNQELTSSLEGHLGRCKLYTDFESKLGAKRTAELLGWLDNAEAMQRDIDEQRRDINEQRRKMEVERGTLETERATTERYCADMKNSTRTSCEEAYSKKTLECDELLRKAKEQADQMLSDARQQSGTIIADAQRERNQLLDAAKTECGTVRNTTQEECRKRIKETEQLCAKRISEANRMEKQAKEAVRYQGEFTDVAKKARSKLGEREELFKDPGYLARVLVETLQDRNLFVALQLAWPSIGNRVVDMVEWIVIRTAKGQLGASLLGP